MQDDTILRITVFHEAGDVARRLSCQFSCLSVGLTYVQVHNATLTTHNSPAHMSWAYCGKHTHVLDQSRDQSRRGRSTPAGKINPGGGNRRTMNIGRFFPLILVQRCSSWTHSGSSSMAFFKGHMSKVVVVIQSRRVRALPWFRRNTSC